MVVNPSINGTLFPLNCLTCALRSPQQSVPSQNPSSFGWDSSVPLHTGGPWSLVWAMIVPGVQIARILPATYRQLDNGGEIQGRGLDSHMQYQQPNKWKQVWGLLRVPLHLKKSLGSHPW